MRDELDCFLCVIEFESKRNALLLLLLLKRSHTTTGIIEQNAMAVEKKRRRDKIAHPIDEFWRHDFDDSRRVE